MSADRPEQAATTPSAILLIDGSVAIPRHPLSSRPRGLRATSGSPTRSAAAGHLLAQAFVGVMSGVAMLTVLITAHITLLELARAVGNAAYAQVVLAIPNALMIAVLVLMCSVIPAFVLWLYASLGLIALVALRIQTRLSVAAVGVLPFAWVWWSEGGRLEPLGAALIVSTLFGAVTAYHRVLRLTLAQRQLAGPQAVLVHDGGSSLCQRYARALPARFLGGLLVCDGRRDSELRTRLLAANLNPERGLIVLTADGSLQGARALRWLATRTAPGVRWLLVDLLFASPLAFVLYPALRVVRAWQLRRSGLPRLDRLAASA